MKKNIKKKILISSLGFVAISSIALVASACSLNKKTKLKLDKENATAKDKDGNLYIKLSTQYDINKLKKTIFQTVFNNEFNIETYPINIKQNEKNLEFYLKLPKVQKESSGIIINPTGFFEPLPFVLLKQQIETNTLIDIDKEGK